MTAMAFALFAAPALLALAVLLSLTDRPARLTLRYAAITVLWTAAICLITARS